MRKNLKDGVDLLKTNPNLENVTTFLLTLLTLFPPPSDDGEKKEEGELQEQKGDGIIVVAPSKNPNFVFELPGYDLNEKLKEVKLRDIDYQSPIGELPFIAKLTPPKRLIILIDNKSYNGDVNFLIDPIINKYFDNPPRPYTVTKFNQLNPVAHEALTNFIFVIGTKHELRNLEHDQIVSYHRNLSESGSLVFISTEQEAQPVFSHQCKNTQFITNFDEPPSLRDRFIKFFAGHFFYMKRFVNADCPRENISNCPSKYSPAFATFKYPSQNTDPPLRASDINLRTAGWVYLEDDELKVGHPAHLVPSNHEYLPLNVVSSVEKANHLKTVLDNDWSTLWVAGQKDSGNIVRALREVIDKLNSKFKFLWVRGGGSCLFVALNASFALKFRPLLTFEMVTHAAVGFLLTFVEPASDDQFNILSTTVFNITQIVNKRDAKTGAVRSVEEEIFPQTKEEIYNIVFENLNQGTRGVYWIFFLCWYLHIEIIMVVQERQRLNPYVLHVKPLDPTQPFNLFDPTYLKGSFPKFYIYLEGGHYYPMFPVQTIPDNIEDWLNKA